MTKNIRLILLTTTSILAIVIVLQLSILTKSVQTISQQTASITTKISSQESQNIQPKTEQSTAFDSNPQIVIARGVIRKEAIPAELEIGDFWYQMYFDEPFLNNNNASGFAQYVDKLRVTPPDHNPELIEEYLNKPVEIYGVENWGYAESKVIKIEAIAEL